MFEQRHDAHLNPTSLKTPHQWQICGRPRENYAAPRFEQMIAQCAQGMANAFCERDVVLAHPVAVALALKSCNLLSSVPKPPNLWIGAWIEA